MLTQNKTLLNIQGPDFHSTLIFACLPLNYSWILACKMTFIYSFLFYWRKFNKLAAQAWCVMETGALTMTQADDGFLDQPLCSVPMYSSHYPEAGHNWSILHLQMTYPNRKMQCQAVSALGMTAEPHNGLDITRDTGQSHTTLEKVQNPFATCSHWVCISFKKKKSTRNWPDNWFNQHSVWWLFWKALPTANFHAKLAFSSGVLTYFQDSVTDLGGLCPEWVTSVDKFPQFCRNVHISTKSTLLVVLDMWSSCFSCPHVCLKQ